MLATHLSHYEACLVLSPPLVLLLLEACVVAAVRSMVYVVVCLPTLVVLWVGATPVGAR